MYSGAVKEREENLPETAGRSHPSDRWLSFPFSQLSHHGEFCCRLAREWLVAMDFAQLNGGDLTTGPRWIRERYEWGPSTWPIHWCEILDRKVIDCGAHAALAHECFLARNVPAFRAQFIQKYSVDATDQWRRKWTDEQVSDHWLGDDVIYHEGNALLVGEDEVKLWDGSASWWVNPRQSGGYGNVVAVRIFAEGRWSGGDEFRWGVYRLKPDVWQQISH